MSAPDTDFNTLIKAIRFNITDSNRRLHIKTVGSERIKTLGTNHTIYEFARSMWQALKIHRPGLVFEPAFPSYVLDKEDAEVLNAGRDAPEIPDEIITWNIVRRAPGGLEGPFSRAKEIQPRVREDLVYIPTLGGIDNPEALVGSDEAKVLGYQIKGQHFDNLIQFDIWSKNNKKAEILAEYIEYFMMTYRPMFLELGMIKLHMHSRLRDEVLLNWRNGLVNRSILYYIRSETVTATPVREIKQINVNLEFHKLLRDINDNTIDDFISQYENSIIRNWIDRNQSINSIT